ncbi:MAG: PASTA domain-containing protein [Phycisphaerales bacterium]
MLNDPYQIATAEQLISVGSDSGLWDEHFALVCDIDMENRSVGPNVIGSFSGVFDGRCFRISNLSLGGGDRMSQVGLFEWIESAGVVKNLILDAVYISGRDGGSDAGALCGANSGVIFRCSVTCGMCEVYWAGGVAAWNNGVVEECRSDCTIVGSGTYGGLIGCNKGRISNCWSSGTLWGRDVGGLVARECYGEILNCYSLCRVRGIGADSSAGGLVSTLDSPTSGITDSYFLDPNSGGGPDNGLGTPLSDGQMKQQATFSGWDFGETHGDGVQNVWIAPTDGYPDLTWYGSKLLPSVAGLPLEDAYATLEHAGFKIGKVICDYDHTIKCGQVITTQPYPIARPDMGLDVVLSLGAYDWSVNAGIGDTDHPYLISSAGQLDCLSYQSDLWDKSFELAGDLDMAGRIYGRAVIGRCDLPGEIFNGTFDGVGHVIRNVTIVGSPADGISGEPLGFFGEAGPQAQIVNLGLVDISLSGTASASGISGMLCGVNRGYIGRCYSRGVAESSGEVGGFVGRNAGLIEDCYAQGSVDGMSGNDPNSPHSFAGFVARNVGGTITTCYSTCLVAPNGGAGFVASHEGGSVERCLWDVEVSDVWTSAGGIGLPTKKLMNGDTLQSNGWGGNPNWILDEGKDYPRLVWEGTPGHVIPSSSWSPRGGTP